MTYTVMLGGSFLLFLSNKGGLKMAFISNARTTEDWQTKADAYAMARTKPIPTKTNATISPQQMLGDPVMDKLASVPNVGAAQAANQASTSSTGSMSTGSPQAGGQPGTTFANGYMEQANKLLTQLNSMQSFNYNYQTDPSYIAAVQRANQGAETASQDTLATMSDRGIMNSSVTANQLGQIQQRAKAAPLELLPQLEANAYSRYQNDKNGQMDMFRTMMQAGQWQQGFDADQAYRDKTFQADERWKEADTTGTYESPEMMKLMNDIIGYKNSFASAGTDAERKQITDAANVARATLAGLTGRSDIDKLLGSGVTRDKALANFGKSGVETSAAKQYREEKDYRTSRDKVTDTRYNQEYKDTNTWRQKEFDQRDSLARLSRASSGGGGGGGGSSLTATKFLISQNTDRMILQMEKDGVKSHDQMVQWLGQHQQDIDAGGVDTGSIMSYFKGDKNDQPRKSDYDLYMDAVDLASKDDSYKHLNTPEQKKKFVDDLTAYLKKLDTPPATAADTRQMLDNYYNSQGFVNQKVQNLSRYK